MDRYQFLDDPDPAFLEISSETSLDFFVKKYTGVLYYGRVGCPYCERAVPVLNQVAKDLDQKIYYIDVSKKIADTTFQKLSGYLSETFQPDENHIPSLFVPDVIAIKDGKIKKYHVGLVPEYHIQENTMLDQTSKEKLYDLYKDLMTSIDE